MTRIICTPKQFENFSLSDTFEPDKEGIAWESAKSEAQAILNKQGGFLGDCHTAKALHDCVVAPLAMSPDALVLGHLYAKWSTALEVGLCRQNKIDDKDRNKYIGRAQFLKTKVVPVKSKVLINTHSPSKASDIGIISPLLFRIASLRAQAIKGTISLTKSGPAANFVMQNTEWLEKKRAPIFKEKQG